MITEIVLFRLPDGLSREEAIAKYPPFGTGLAS